MVPSDIVNNYISIVDLDGHDYSIEGSSYGH